MSPLSRWPSFVTNNSIFISTVSRPPEVRTRKVLGSSTTSSNNVRSPTLASSKPIRARVDLSSLASPPTSPSLCTANWTPNHPVRVKAKSTIGGGVGGIRSAPTTPTVQQNGTFRSTPTTNGFVRAALSPHTPATSGGGTRAISPQQRARSPDAATARARTTPKVATQTANADLRGQGDPFPSSSNNPLPTPITHLPSSVSVRRLHSPTLRQSQRQERERESYLSTSTSTNASSTSSSSVLPPLSTSPSSIASSPLTSPNLYSLYDSASSSTLSPPSSHSNAGLGFYDQSSLGQKAGTSARGAGVRRTSGVSSVSSTSDCPPPPNGGGLLPPFPSYSSSYPTTITPDYPPPLPSSPSILSSYSSTNPLRSPTLPSSSSSKTLKSSSISSASTSRPVRTRTITCSSSGSVSVPFPTTNPFSTTAATVDSPVSSTQGQRARVDQMDWSTPQYNERRESTESQERGSGGLASPGLKDGFNHAMESLLRESIEKEIEAKVSRRIMDLEIRTSSLLSINAQLERQKLKQTSEMRELRRKLRESLGGGGRQRFDLDEIRSTSSGGELSDIDYDDEDEDGEPQPSWEELLRTDKSFGQVANLVDGMLKRGKKAVEYKVEEKSQVGRVLSTVEMEDRFEEEEGGESGSGSGNSSDGEGSVE
ncbi:hypothetical protein JCM5353_006385 [Sporobolomyces roseus]